MQLSREWAAFGEVVLRATVRGHGTHRFTVRADNLLLESATQQATLTAGQTWTFTWRAKVAAADEPWVAVLVPDGDPSQRAEWFGTPGAMRR